VLSIGVELESFAKQSVSPSQFFPREGIYLARLLIIKILNFIGYLIMFYGTDIASISASWNNIK